MIVFDLKNLSDSLGVEVYTREGQKVFCLADFTGDVSFGASGDDFYLGVSFGTDLETEAAFGIPWGGRKFGIYEEYRKATGSTLTDDEIDEGLYLWESKWAEELDEKFKREVLTALRTGGL